MGFNWGFWLFGVVVCTALFFRYKGTDRSVWGDVEEIARIIALYVRMGRKYGE